ncbi:MAG: PDZ domain-containing protein [Desulfobacterales bacterium]|nr:PDZ domain-containing protein [Desulfobacterales bacterium]
MSKPYHIVFNLLALSILIYTGVDLFYKIVNARLRQVDTKTLAVQQMPDDKNRRKPPLDDYRLIIDRNVFGSAEKPSKEVKAEEIEALEPTSLKIALLGTVTGNPQNIVAVIEETDIKKQGLYKVGDSIQDAVIKMILRGKVVLRIENRDEILTMDETRRPPPEKTYQVSIPVGRVTTVTVSRSDVKKSLENINELLSQVRIRPHFKDGRPDGLALSRIRRGSIFAKLGLKNGDIVHGVNNRNIHSPDDMMNFYAKLKSGSRVSLQINRRGQRKTINYKFR